MKTAGRALISAKVFFGLVCTGTMKKVKPTQNILLVIMEIAALLVIMGIAALLIMGIAAFGYGAPISFAFTSTEKGGLEKERLRLW